MNHLVIIAAVGLAAYALLDLFLSAFVAIVWRTRAVAPLDLPPHVRARRLLRLRFVPSAGAATITLAVITPAFAIHEPAGQDESMGPALAVLALAALLQIGVSVFVAARSAWLTARLERTWLRSATKLEAGGMPAFVIDTPSPIVALVGVFSPRVMAARTVIEACSPSEIAAIIGHEQGHLQARDNFKRWVMAALPDTLRWTPIHDEIVSAWHLAAEDTADDAATGGDAAARADLAALLLKVIRLAPRPLWDVAVVSPFVESDGLDRRVRRLLRPELEPPAPLSLVPLIAVALIVLAGITALALPEAREAIFQALERLVAFGR
jgi:Zn-dependent protease with chaperone function